MNNDDVDLTHLIERSSLGTEGARLLRQRASTKSVESVVAAANEHCQDDLDVLVSAAIDGQPDAIDSVLRWIRPLVVRYCRSRFGDQDNTSASTDDMAQEVCLAVITALPSYREQGGRFLDFVYGIASHKLADAQLSAARNRLSEQMAKLLDLLPARQREVVLLRVVAGLSIEKTAEALGRTPDAVRVAEHLALHKLRAAFAPEDRTDNVVSAQARQRVEPEEFTAHVRHPGLGDLHVVLTSEICEALSRR